MTVINEKEMQDKRKKVESVFQIFGLGKPNYTPQSLILTDNNNESHLIDENNFDYLQERFRKTGNKCLYVFVFQFVVYVIRQGLFYHLFYHYSIKLWQFRHKKPI